MSESTRKVQNVRQLITQIRQKVFQKGAFPAVIIYLERMVTIMKRFYTAESVTEGHPDKLCDLIADSILDACLKEDENSRVACEVLATKRNIIVAGEITSRFEPQVFEIIKKHFKPFALIILAASIVAALITLFLIPKKYTAEAKLIIVQKSNPDSQQISYNDLQTSQKLVNTFIEILKRTCQRCRGSGHHDWLRLR